MGEAYKDRRRIGKDELDDLFERIGAELPEKTVAWDIGGSPMVYRGLKAGTKDADLVLDNVIDRDRITSVLLSEPFTYREAGFLPGYEGMEGRLLRCEGALGVDLFVRRIMDGFRLTTTMKDRAEGPFTFGRLELYHCANEDIFLLKAITHRPDDDQDVLILAGTGLDTEVMRNEMIVQNRLGGGWQWRIFHALEAIEERSGVSIPIKSEIIG